MILYRLFELYYTTECHTLTILYKNSIKPHHKSSHYFGKYAQLILSQKNSNLTFNFKGLSSCKLSRTGIPSDRLLLKNNFKINIKPFSKGTNSSSNILKIKFILLKNFTILSTNPQKSLISSCT